MRVLFALLGDCQVEGDDNNILTVKECGKIHMVKYDSENEMIEVFRDFLNPDGPEEGFARDFPEFC